MSSTGMHVPDRHLRADLHMGADHSVITVVGELDSSSVEKFRDAVRRALIGGTRILVVDLGPITFLGSAGLAALMWTDKIGRRVDTSVRFVCPPENRLVSRPIELTGLAAYLALFPTQVDAAQWRLPHDGQV
ncbi:STAS domain-containing protein [Pseudonocardia ailaonensis]|uniref:STAS domain-containing protein n=1 Tax=Pseudonocardia ailaonensis TaxID=367279 RepID=UPI0031DDF6B4